MSVLKLINWNKDILTVENITDKFQSTQIISDITQGFGDKEYIIENKIVNIIFNCNISDINNTVKSLYIGLCVVGKAEIYLVRSVDLESYLIKPDVKL